MRTFINVEDIGPLDKAMAEAFEIKNDRFKYQHLGKNKTLMMIFCLFSLAYSFQWKALYTNVISHSSIPTPHSQPPY